MTLNPHAPPEPLPDAEPLADADADPPVAPQAQPHKSGVPRDARITPDIDDLIAADDNAAAAAAASGVADVADVAAPAPAPPGHPSSSPPPPSSSSPRRDARIAADGVPSAAPAAHDPTWRVPPDLHTPADVRRHIRQISRDASLSEREKSRRSQAVHSHRFNKRQRVDARAFRATMQDTAASAPHDFVLPDGTRMMGCEHYPRKCKLFAECCRMWVTCRRCHDHPAQDHNLDRFATRRVRCMVCGHEQRACAACARCGSRFARYFCALCKLYDDTPAKQIYHCDKCGICRVGKGLGYDNYHCDHCNACVSLKYHKLHKCHKKSLDADCSICHHYLFTSTSPVVFMRCGHTMHAHCFDDYTAENYTCPLCHKALTNMTAYYELIDAHVARETVPPEYAGKRCQVLCYDCDRRSVTPYHYVYLKCGHAACAGYNTALIRAFDAHDPAAPRLTADLSPGSASGSGSGAASGAASSSASGPASGSASGSASGPAAPAAIRIAQRPPPPAQPPPRARPLTGGGARGYQPPRAREGDTAAARATGAGATGAGATGAGAAAAAAPRAQHADADTRTSAASLAARHRRLVERVRISPAVREWQMRFAERAEAMIAAGDTVVADPSPPPPPPPPPDSRAVAPPARSGSAAGSVSAGSAGPSRSAAERPPRGAADCTPNPQRVDKSDDDDGEDGARRRR